MFSLGLCSCPLAGHANRLNSDGFCYLATIWSNKYRKEVIKMMLEVNLDF